MSAVPSPTLFDAAGVETPEQAAPPKPKVHRCRFCRATIPANDEGLIAWGMCEPCFEGAEFK